MCVETHFQYWKLFKLFDTLDYQYYLKFIINMKQGKKNLAIYFLN